MPTLLDLPSGSYYISTPHIAGHNSAGNDLDLRQKMSMSSWTTASIDWLGSWGTFPTGCQWLWGLDATGHMAVAIIDNTATLFQYFSTVTTGLASNAVKWVRWLHQPSAGTTKFYLSDDGSAWTQLGTTVATTTNALQSFTGNPPVITVGSEDSGAGRFVGQIYRSMVIINGVTVNDIDWTIQTVGAATVTATTGETWSIAAPGAIVAAPDCAPARDTHTAIPFTQGAGGGALRGGPH